MTEKDTASMTTVQMKADYAASEVYSTASEPPPAYKRQSNSVKIAKITAFTIIVSSFVLGSFILASSYLQARASCDQVQALDSVLEKELMLETLQQVNKELPRAEALLGRENIDDDDLQNFNKMETPKRVETKSMKSSPSEEEDNMNKLSDDSEEADAMRKFPGNVPLELDLSDLAAALLQNNKKSRMNCVVERKHAEELVDSPSKTVALPFGMNLTTDPKKARITGERISIFCEGGNESKEQDSSKSSRGEDDDDTDEEVESIRPMFIPYQRVPIPFGPIPNRFPLTHMPQRMEPMMPQRQFEPQGGYFRQMAPPPPPPFQQLPMRPPMPPQVMQAPHPEPQRVLRIQVHQIPLRELIHVADDVPQQIQVQQQQQQQSQQQQVPMQQQQQPQQQQQSQNQQRPDMPFFQIQRMPLGLALERAGITAEDLANIQRMTEDRINEEFRRLAIDSDEDENNSNSSEDDDNQSSMAAANNNNSEQEKSQQQDSQQSGQQEMEQQQQRQGRMQPMPIQRLILQPLPEQPRDTMTPPMPDHRMPMGHPGWGRSLAQPVSIPVPMMEGQNDMSGQEDQSASSSVAEESERPHFVHPRSV